MTELIVFAAVWLAPIVVILGLLAWLTVPRANKSAVVAGGAIAGVLAIVLSLLAGVLYNDPRPFTLGVHPLLRHVADNGFPSDHTTLSMLTAFVVWAFNRTVGTILFALAVGVALGRIYSGMHHVLDVTGSTAIAAASFGISEFFKPLIRRLAARRLRRQEKVNLG